MKRRHSSQSWQDNDAHLTGGMDYLSFLTFLGPLGSHGHPNQPQARRASLALVTPVEVSSSGAMAITITDNNNKSSHDDEDESGDMDMAMVTMEVEPSRELDDGLNDSSDGEGEEICIPEDSFSMFYVADTWLSHVAPVIVYTMQMWILALIMQSLLRTEGNAVPLQVKILACFVSVFTASDLVDGLLFIGRPIGRKYMTNITTWQAGRNQTKWEISNFMRLSEGIFTVCVSFRFVALSETIVDLFLNFAGVAFVSEMDDAFYKLAAKGVLGKSAKELAGKVSECSYNTKKKNAVTKRALRYIILALIPIGMLIGLIFLDTNLPVEGLLSIHLQHNGDGANSCSACKKHSLWKSFFWVGDSSKCISFPRYPLIFEGATGTKMKLQVGLNLDETHFSVFVSNNGTYFGDYEDSRYYQETCQSIFSVEGEANKLLSFKRKHNLKEQTSLNFAVLLDNRTDLPGEVVDSGDIECLFESNMFESNHKKMDCNRPYSQTYLSLPESNLARAWITFDLKVLTDFVDLSHG